MIRAGRLDKRLAVQMPRRTQADDGAETVAWVTVGSIWAELRQKGATETFRNRVVTATATHAARIRPWPQLQTDWRFTRGDHVYGIDGIDDSRADEWIVSLKEIVT